jgi:hypothetical protein
MLAICQGGWINKQAHSNKVVESGNRLWYDIQCHDFEPRELRDIVQQVYAEYEIGGLELAPTWTHIDWHYNLDGSLTVIELKEEG